MKTTAIAIGRAAVERLAGDGPSAMRALLAATLTGGATGAITYKLLRSQGGAGED